MTQETAETESKAWKSLGVGAIAGVLGWGCCLSPLVLLFLGLTGVSGAMSLAMVLNGQYHWVFVILSIVFMVGAIYFNLRRKKVCSLQGVKRQKNMVLGTVVGTIAVYFAMQYALFTWILPKVFG